VKKRTKKKKEHWDLESELEKVKAVEILSFWREKAK